MAVSSGETEPEVWDQHWQQTVQFSCSASVTVTNSNSDRPRAYTRRQINQDRMIFGDFSVNSEPIFFKFYKGHFLFES